MSWLKHPSIILGTSLNVSILNSWGFCPQLFCGFLCFHHSYDWYAVAHYWEHLRHHWDYHNFKFEWAESPWGHYKLVSSFSTITLFWLYWKGMSLCLLSLWFFPGLPHSPFTVISDISIAPLSFHSECPYDCSYEYECRHQSLHH